MLSRSLCFCLALLVPALSARAWGPMHAAITDAAIQALPAWEQELIQAQRARLIEFDCMIPDLVRAPVNRKTLGRFATLPNGDPFTHEPHSRAHNYRQILHYLASAVDKASAGDLDEASRFAGCLLHFLEDCGSPAHSIPGDNQHGLMKDLLVVPEAYRDRPLHGLIEDGKLALDLKDYRPRLLGTTPREAAMHLVERLNQAVRSARSQVIPILQGVFAGQTDAVDAARRRAATFDAEVAADALHTIFAIARNRFEPAELVALEQVELDSLTPNEVIAQAYFPQHAYFSNPYFGYPVLGGTLANGTERRPLVLAVMKDGRVNPETFGRGFGLGTHTTLSFTLPEKVYDRFTCLLGLHPELGAKGSVAFRIFFNGEAVVDTGIITGADPAREIDLPLWRVEDLRIEVEARGPQTPASNFAIIALPTLRKAAAPPALDQDRVR